MWATNPYIACKPSERDELAEPIEKELKELEELRKAFHTLSKENEKVMKELSKEIEKNKALEIIKSKGIDIDLLKYHKDLEHYNFSLRGRFEHLTQEEYDLLKEVLNNG